MQGRKNNYLTLHVPLFKMTQFLTGRIVFVYTGYNHWSHSFALSKFSLQMVLHLPSWSRNIRLIKSGEESAKVELKPASLYHLMMI